jgi:hypothetical protein
MREVHRRLTRLEQQGPLTGQGLAALLQAAKGLGGHHEPLAPWDIDADSGLHGLLREAQAWRAAQPEEGQEVPVPRRDSYAD